MPAPAVPVFFHPAQLAHKPRYEWAFGRKIAHPETTHRAETIHAALAADAGTFSIRPPSRKPVARIAALHDPRLLTLYRTAKRELPPGKTLHPSVFPRREQMRGDARRIEQAGYFCFDSGTPLTAATWEAAVWSAACAVSAGRAVLAGETRLAYGLCRPPGHHATRDLFGGYCYFNNAALVAELARDKGRVAIVDIDFHHGNGTQDLYYRDKRVLFVSIHGDPREFYPYFSGHAGEAGEGPGEGFTMNLPIPKGCDGKEYLRVVARKVLPALRAFRPSLLVLSAGFDTYREDPIGGFSIDTPDYHALGEVFGHLALPTVVVQEGGYAVAQLGVNVATFLGGLRDGQARPPAASRA